MFAAKKRLLEVGKAIYICLACRREQFKQVTFENFAFKSSTLGSPLAYEIEVKLQKSEPDANLGEVEV